jgi:hypothetical protein
MTDRRLRKSSHNRPHSLIVNVRDAGIAIPAEFREEILKNVVRTGKIGGQVDVQNKGQISYCCVATAEGTEVLFPSIRFLHGFFLYSPLTRVFPSQQLTVWDHSNKTHCMRHSELSSLRFASFASRSGVLKLILIDRANAVRLEP